MDSRRIAVVRFTWLVIFAVLILQLFAGCEKHPKQVEKQPQESEVSQKQGVLCSANADLISSAVYGYVVKNHRYPKHLNELVPEYIKEIPTCPSAGKDTYSESYRVSEKEIPMFTLYCKGEHHVKVGLPANNPVKSSAANFIMKDGKMLVRPGYSYATECGARETMIGKVLEKWAQEHQGKYPEDLRMVVPAELECLPPCPLGNMSYQQGYEVSQDKTRFTLSCTGTHVQDGFPEKYPKYVSGKGLKVKP